MTEDLKKLRTLLTSAIDSIIDVCQRRKEDWPSLAIPAKPLEATKGDIQRDPDVVKAVSIGVAAAHQLLAALQPPVISMTSLCGKALVVANVCAVERTHVAEILRPVGEQGMHITDIAKHNGTVPDKLGQILRHLATNHIFKEVSPDVFANNRLSSVLDTGKHIDDIRSAPDEKFEETDGIVAWISHNNDVSAKASMYIDHVMTDFEYAASQELNHASVQKAFKTDQTFWGYLDSSDNSFFLRRFNKAMQGASSMQPPSAVLKLYDWSSLPQGAVMVDVGGGLGHVSMEVSTVRPDFTFVVEDRPPVMAAARAYWEKHAPAVAPKVHFLSIDYFQPQPKLPAVPDVFFLRAIIHDLPDKYAVILLSNIRKAAKPDTKLLIVDAIIDHACEVPDDPQFQVPGYVPPIVPEPLLPSSASGEYFYDLDMLMLNLLNAKERTIRNWHQIFADSGWKLAAVHRAGDNRAWWPLLVGVTAD